MERGISLERARTLIEMEKIELSVERVNLDNAYGRVLGKGLASKVEDPRFDNSAMDGWAVKKEDCPLTENKSLEIVGISQAGSSQTPTIRLGQACKIMTGAQMPEGADAIVMVEDSEIDGNKVIISGPARETYIRRKGENLSKGKEALFAGDFMSPATISLAATMGYEYIDVYRKPIIGIISTGDELVLPGSKIKDWEIYESNSFGIAALVEKMGGTPIRYDVVTDSLDKLRDSLNHAAKNCDAIITTGGVSMGDWDIVRKLMELEGDIIFWRVNIRPGGPPIFGKWNEIPIFGLPGNSISSSACFRFFVYPYLLNILGVKAEKAFKAKLKKNYSKNKKIIKFLKARLTSTNDGKLELEVLKGQESFKIKSFVKSNVWGLFKDGQSKFKKGELIDCYSPVGSNINIFK